jgi:hypothetical protein
VTPLTRSTFFVETTKFVDLAVKKARSLTQPTAGRTVVPLP